MSIKAKAKMTSQNNVQVKMLIKHPMETGQRKDSKTGELIPAHFVDVVTCQLAGKGNATGALGSCNFKESVSFIFD